jgi:hypothetical protein
MVSASDPAQVARDATCGPCRHCTIIVTHNLVQSHNVCGKTIEIFGSWIGPLHLSYGGCRFFQSRLPVMPDRRIGDDTGLGRASISGPLVELETAGLIESYYREGEIKLK